MQDASAGTSGGPEEPGRAVRVVRHRRRLPPQFVACAVVAAMLLSMVGFGLRDGRAQQSQATPPAANGNSPYAEVIAQGLAFFDREVQYVWRVREITLPSADEAESANAIAYSFIYQRTGTGIVRNDVSQRRVAIEPGEATYFSADDPYTRYAYGGDPRPSTAWIIELADASIDAADLDGEVVYESQVMNGVPGETWDLELLRNVLQPGETAVTPDHAGAALILSSFGEITTSTEDGNTQTLGTGEGEISNDNPTITNGGDRQVTYLIAYLGQRIFNPGEEPQPTEAPEEGAEGTPVAAGTPVAEGGGPTDDDDEDGLTNEEEAELGTEPNNADTDGDGLNDGAEQDGGTDPNNADSDGDDLNDGDEVNTYQTDPNNIDTDTDGYADGEEVLQYQTDPNDAGSVPQ